MIQKQALEDIVNEFLSENDLILVDMIISKIGKINIFIDSSKGVTIGECEKLSRAIENKLDRDQEDFELEVSSPGLDRPLKLPFQFKKNVGRQLEVVKTDGIQVKGTLTRAGDKEIEIEFTIKEKKEGSKNKQLVAKKLVLDFNEIKTAKVIVKF